MESSRNSLDLDKVLAMVKIRTAGLIDQLTVSGDIDLTNYRRGQIEALRWVAQIPAMREEEESFERDRQEVEWK